ncbi:hypothetical protein CW362_11850 [Streptomyces populi]|uniref:Uncharacterized protein n=1 Tax=Streptomyces populi TaxID=2058924 RepID=A0A2I0SS82_9ACTN|nr:hypothetical protein [Streptomyces populi]PKT72796.1 hypothetical protein CW362_11850 [Streptomyces populi]
MRPVSEAPPGSRAEHPGRRGSAGTHPPIPRADRAPETTVRADLAPKTAGAHQAPKTAAAEAAEETS